MDHKVLTAFIDKNTGIGYNEGNTFSSNDAERVSFLAERGFIEGPKEEQVKKDAPRRKSRAKDNS